MDAIKQRPQQELQQSSWTPASPSPHRLPDEEGWAPRARVRGRARAGQSFAGRRCRGAGRAPLRRARPSEDEDEDENENENRAPFENSAAGRASRGVRTRAFEARARENENVPRFSSRARARGAPLLCTPVGRCVCVALPRYRTRRGRRARSHPFAGFRGRPSAKWEVRGGCFSREYIRGMRSR